MEKRKPWQLFVIVAVLLLTFYNILPTIFYYSNPLKEPIGTERALVAAEGIVNRTNALEEDAVSWLHAFSKLLHVKPQKIELRDDDVRFVDVVFTSSGDASRFKAFLPKAGALIPFVPAQLQPGTDSVTDNVYTVTVERQIGVHLDPNEISNLFQFSEKFEANGEPTRLHRDLVYDRVSHLAAGFGGTSPRAREVIALHSGSGAAVQELTVSVAQELVDAEKTLAAKNAPLFRRYLGSYSQGSDLPQEGAAQALIARMTAVQGQLRAQRQVAAGNEKEADFRSLDPEVRERITLLDRQLETLTRAIAVVQQHKQDIDAGVEPLTTQGVRLALANGDYPIERGSRQQRIPLADHNPFIKALRVDWGDEQVVVELQDDVEAIRAQMPQSEEAAYVQDKVGQLVVNSIATVSQQVDETILPQGENYGVTLSPLTSSESFLALDLGFLAKKEAEGLYEQLVLEWFTQHPDLAREVYPIRTFDEHKNLQSQEQRLGLVVYAPATYVEDPPEGFDSSSIYVIARGLDDIVSKYREVSAEDSSQQLLEDFNGLVGMLEQRGFTHYPGKSWGVDKAFAHDYIFRLPNYYDYLLKASREDFNVKGSKRYAVLDFTDVEQRILTRNRIEDKIHEDLLKWRDEYSAGQVELNPANRFYIPAPTKNAYWENLKLSWRKYFRGDDSKILRWGLDLSGGKTVRIGLTDQNNLPVTKEEDLKQAVNELYTRINKMGVAERTIRIEGSHIILDFPGAQGLSASELVKASTMHFHIVNEKFSTENRDLAEATNRFLQDVWNEASVTNRKDLESINLIAWKHLGGDVATGELRPRSAHAKSLYEAGLRLASPTDRQIGGAFDDTVSAIAMYRGDDYSEWFNQTHPLLFVFRNYALEGSSLADVQVGYDPTDGNFLSFEVAGKYEGKERSGSPRDDFYAWTSQFSKDQIVGTPKEQYSQGRGWRMAVILNDHVISSPSLEAALKDRARITGRFSQREVNQLAADLKAGSLSFTPRILSEQNVSPDLGKEERSKGIVASLIALTAVVVAMVAYYRLAGIVASCAVLLNLIIMWGVLQNLGAALTLPGIAGIVLTIGMAVDANVLVFERIREEFSVSGRISSAIHTGYRKAFSAIVDSNVTTIIAAIILTQFDSGPIKGFAITLIIGIVSSMFTALFMTRYFFAGWVQNPKNRELKMAHLIGNTNYDFLARSKAVIMVSVLVVAVGSYLLVNERNTIFGMDFTGGYSLTVELQEDASIDNYRSLAKQAIEEGGVSTKDVQIQQLSRPNQLRIQLGMGIEEEGLPFHNMPQELTEGRFEFPYQMNPRIDWVVEQLSSAGLTLPQSELDNLPSNWTVMSGQFSDAMRNNAIWALGLALGAILLYITFRFEFKYAIAAVIALAHDVAITLGILALFHMLGFPVQIDLEVIGAIMTIIGYSLNDTIIVFDRIREDIRLMRKMSFPQIINHAINVTLSRTIMTSGTTLLVLISLVLLGGPAIFGFSLVMTIGVMVGTISSLFVAPAAMLFFHEREETQEAKVQLRKA